MLHVIVFDALLVSACGYALWRGGSPERIVGGSLILAYVATLVSYSALANRFFGVERGVFAVDVVLLAVLIAVAIRADRAWPLVVAALQLDTVGAHVVKTFDVGMIRVTYALLIAIWSYPMLLALGFGTFRHQLRLRRDGYDLSWCMRPDEDDRASPESGWLSGVIQQQRSRSDPSGACSSRVSPISDLSQGRGGG